MREPTVGHVATKYPYGRKKRRAYLIISKGGKWVTRKSTMDASGSAEVKTGQAPLIVLPANKLLR